MRRSTRFPSAPVVWAASLVCAAALAICAPALARVTTPLRVSPSGLQVQQSDVAVGGDRTVVLMAGYVAPARAADDWSLLARLGEGRRLGSPVRLTSGSVIAGQVAAGADGTAVAAWTIQAQRGVKALRVAVARPGHGFGRAQTLAQARSLTLGGLGVTTSGRAVVAWRLGTSGTPVQVALAAPGRTFGAAQTLGVSRQYAPTVTVTPDGRIVVAWLNTPPAPQPPPAPRPTVTTARVLVRTLAPGAPAFGPATDLGALTVWYSGPGAASGPGGAAVTWRQTPLEQRLVPLSSTGTFEPAVPLAATGPPRTGDAGLPDRLALAIPAARTTVALWLEARAGTAVVKTATLPSGRSFSSPRMLSAEGWRALAVAAVAFPDRALGAWTEVGTKGARVRLAVRPVGGGWTTMTPLVAPSLNAMTLAAAASPTYAAVTWVQNVGTSPTSLGGGRMYLTTYRPGA
jgi:hypothetical protein